MSDAYRYGACEWCGRRALRLAWRRDDEPTPFWGLVRVGGLAHGDWGLCAWVERSDPDDPGSDLRSSGGCYAAYRAEKRIWEAR